MANVHVYIITHLDGDPQFRHKTLEMGNYDCMKKMRLSVKKNDWVVAKLGKRFYSRNNKKRLKKRVFLKTKLDFNKYEYLFYAMKVKSIKPGQILCSTKGNYLCFSNPQKIPTKFDHFLPEQQSPTKFSIEKGKKFIAWIRKKKANVDTSMFDDSHGIDEHGIDLTCEKCTPKIKC